MVWWWGQTIVAAHPNIGLLVVREIGEAMARCYIQELLILRLDRSHQIAKLEIIK